MPSIDFIKSEYPLHWLVWNNEYKELDKELSKKVVSISVKGNCKATYCRQINMTLVMIKTKPPSKFSYDVGRCVVITY
jgi:hypothetical protein